MSDVEITAVRDAHKFDESALATYMAEHVEGFSGPLQVRQFEGGQSNPTFQLITPNTTYVMRKQPPGELLPSAHQVDREYKVMHALADTDVPVPKMFCLCEDPEVIGTKFYIMEMVEGRLFTETQLPALSKEERRAIYLDLARVMAKLHAVDVDAVGLREFGRPGNYYERQIGRWTKQYVAAKTEELPNMDRLMSWLPENVPAESASVIVHGDYRLGNVLIHPSEPKIVAVLDWELSTLGDGIADLGYLCQEYHGEGYEDDGLYNCDFAATGIPTEEEFVDEYCKTAGRDGIENWPFYLVYNMFRSASIIQGVYKRGLDGNASSEKALEYKDHCRTRSQRAVDLMDRLGLG
ncbi:MAG: phosphotransferase [Pseudomonadota bacterium]